MSFLVYVCSEAPNRYRANHRVLTILRWPEAIRGEASIIEFLQRELFWKSMVCLHLHGSHFENRSKIQKKSQLGLKAEVLLNIWKKTLTDFLSQNYIARNLCWSEILILLIHSKVLENWTCQRLVVGNGDQQTFFQIQLAIDKIPSFSITVVLQEFQRSWKYPSCDIRKIWMIQKYLMGTLGRSWVLRKS